MAISRPVMEVGSYKLLCTRKNLTSYTHVKISQLVNKMCSQQACSNLVNKLQQRCYFIKLRPIPDSPPCKYICYKAVNKLCSHCLSQVVNKFGISC
jgi:hypothetical protein